MARSVAWKSLERQAAKYFGCLRQVLSGSSNRPDRSSSDSTHDRLFIEAKYRAKHAVVKLWKQTSDHAKREGKTPVVVVKQHRQKGFLLVVHCDDLAYVWDERFQAVANDPGCVSVEEDE
jgi:hypothetical protein